MSYVVKAAVGPLEGVGAIAFDEKTMYRGKDVRPGDEIFIFASDHQGGQGLCARGIVTAAERGAGIRVRIEVRPIALARQPLGRRELREFRERQDGDPRTELARKLYRQATNKVAGISDETAAFLLGYF